MTSHAQPDLSRFHRERIVHGLTVRTIEVLRIAHVGPFIRLTCTGPDLDDWVSAGPTDHVKLFFPDPETGEIIAPQPAGPGETGIIRPDRPMLSRDYTPVHLRTDEQSGQRVFDLDFLPHDHNGPAANWAKGARVGDPLVMAGPRGSFTAPTAAPRLILAVDASALPSASRWLIDMPASAEIHVVFDTQDGITAAAAGAYLSEQSGRSVTVVPASDAADGLATAVRELEVDVDTYVFAAGEAARLVPLRRLLKGELGLPRAQYAVSGYWKRGTVGFDHHAPIDPEDPED